MLMFSVNSIEQSRVTPAYILLILNGVQIGLMGVFSLYFLYTMLFGLCVDNNNKKNHNNKNNKNNNKIGNIY